MSELRKDPITGQWVIIASERSKRPKDYSMVHGVNKTENCPFCYGNEHLTPVECLAFRPSESQPHSPDWWVRVVPNKFPALGSEGDVSRRADGMYDHISGVGAHEVLIETPDHEASLASMPAEHVCEVLWAYRMRLQHHSDDPRIGYILIFKNHGPEAGASLEHPHTQLIATPIVPIRVKEELRGAERYYDYKDRCVFCDMISQEERRPCRLVEDDDLFVTMNPYASRFPFETWILPRRHMGRFEDMTYAEMDRLAVFLKRTLGRMYNALDNPPFNFMLHVAPPRGPELPYYHWHLEIIPTLTMIAGFEWGSGFYVNPTPPEEACTYLREADWEVPLLHPSPTLESVHP